MYTGTLTLPKWRKGEPMWSRVGWLWDSDLDEGERAIWDVEYRPDQERASCWKIPLYERHKSTCGYLVLHATRGNGNDGGTITLAINMTPQYDVAVRRSVTVVPAQSNPKRHVDADFWREDGA